MGFYRWLQELGWPRSYLGKLVFVAFVTIAIPLLVFTAYLSLNPAKLSALPLLLISLLTALAGTALFFLAIYWLLMPIRMAIQALNAYFIEGRIVPLPTRYPDEVGLLLRDLAYLLYIIEQRRLKLEQTVAEDALTHLLNRRAANDRLQQSLRLADRNQLPLCIAVLEVDCFREINEHYGFAVGDRVLVALSQVLRERLRGSDWAARWTPEEFLVVLFTDATGSQIALERLRQQLSGEVTEEANLRFTVSIGYTLMGWADWPQYCTLRAERALYDAKQMGGNCVQFHQD